MSAKERYLNKLLKRDCKERWVAAIMLVAPAEVLKTITIRQLR